MTVGRIPNIEGGIQPTLLTTTGDIMYASSASNPARLGIGTASQILAVNSGATAPEWVAPPASGGMTLISTTTLTGGSVDLTSIPSTYKDLQLIIRNFKPTGDGDYLWMRFNSDSNTRYSTRAVTANNSTFGATQMQITNSNDNSVATGLSATTIYDYANAVTWKTLSTLSLQVNETTTTNYNYYISNSFYNQTAAISSITLGQTGASFTSGTALLYGVK